MIEGDNSNRGFYRMEFRGFERPNGTFGVRNYVSILPSVGCSNEVARSINNKVNNTATFLHHQGCCQLHSDIEVIEKTLVGFGENPNTAAILIVSLGCETLNANKLADAISRSGKPVEIINIQKIGGYSKAIKKGLKIAREMVSDSSKIRRSYTDIGSLTVGLKCGASDTTSGLVSNPAVGKTVNRLIESGCTVIMGETTEFIGAEHIIARRAKDEKVKKDFLTIVKQMEERVKSLGFDMRGSQPTSGNIAGGITTIEEKSLGAIIKSGTSPINGILKYAEHPNRKGLYIMDTPGFELYVLSGLSAAGSQIILFSTGLGAPQGFPLVPVIKITGNPRTCRSMREHIDVCLGDIIEGGGTLEEAGEKIYKNILTVASGKKTRTEILDYDQTVDIYTEGPLI